LGSTGPPGVGFRAPAGPEAGRPLTGLVCVEPGLLLAPGGTGAGALGSVGLGEGGGPPPPPPPARGAALGMAGCCAGAPLGPGPGRACCGDAIGCWPGVCWPGPCLAGCGEVCGGKGGGACVPGEGGAWCLGGCGDT
jgi:hypothetical protein